MNTFPRRWSWIRGGSPLFLQTVGQRFSSARANAKSRFLYPEGMIPHEEDYVEQPEYPEIDKDTHQWTEKQKNKRQATLDWHKRIQNQPNPEAKTVEFNLPRHFGWRSLILGENMFDYDSEEMYRFITRTELIEDKLPEVYSSPDLDKQAKYFAEKLQKPILEAIQFELDEQCRDYDELTESKASIDFKKSQSLLNQINRVILSVLGSEVEHLNDCQVDFTPKIEAFWFVGGQQPSKPERNMRLNIIKGLKKLKKTTRAIIKEEGDPVERALQYKGSPLLQIRCENPVSNFVEKSSPYCERNPDSPLMFQHTLHHFGLNKEYNYASIIPGTWTGDGHKCGHITFHSRHHLLDAAVQASEHWKADYENALASQTILASFCRLLAQAFYFGFDQFSDLKYPFSGQTVITDGLKWSFSAYQLNTLHLSDLHLAKNKKQNICWKLKTMSILNETEPMTVNKDTLETLLKFYLLKPTPISEKNPTPYLKASLQEWDDEIQKEIIYYNYRDMVSQRWYIFDTMLKRRYPEIYEWEYIYKIRHPQRYQERRRRFFELPKDFPGSKPYDQQYKLLNPRFVWKRMQFLMAEVAATKEQERIDEAKRAESAKYGIIEQSETKKKPKKR